MVHTSVDENNLPEMRIPSLNANSPPKNILRENCAAPEKVFARKIMNEHEEKRNTENAHE